MWRVMVFFVLFHQSQLITWVSCGFFGANLCVPRKTPNLNDKTYEFKNVEHAVGL